MTKAKNAMAALQNASAYRGFERTFNDFDNDTSVRSDFNRGDYEYFRPSDRLPKDPQDSVAYCEDVYYAPDASMIKNTIDLMSEFACYGIKISHPVPSIDRFFKSWFNKCNGYVVSERFLNYLYRHGNVFVHTNYAKISAKVKKNMKSVKGSESSAANRIPLEYTFLNPCSIKAIGKRAGVFLGKCIYAVKVGNIDDDLQKIKEELGEEVYNEYLNNLTDFQKKVIKEKIKYIPLDDSVSKYFYKKDNWQAFAYPLMHSILRPWQMIQKMHLADINALDGALSQIRLWTLGLIDPSNLNNSYLPSDAHHNALKNMLLKGASGGVLDLIWTPDLNFKESQSNSYKFLGKAKYEQPLTELKEGLGIPYGSTGGGGGFNSNYVSMQTMIKRLNYGRQILLGFWNEQIAIVQKEMGFAKPAVLEMGSLSLSDDATLNKLLMEMYDRNMIDDDVLLEHAGVNPSTNQAKMKRRDKMRNDGRIPEKVGPFLRSERQMKIASDLKQQEMAQNQQTKQPKDNGRPANQKDSTKRKQRIDASFEDWYESSVSYISKTLMPYTLSQEEHLQFVFNVMSKLDDMEDVSLDRIVEILKDNNENIPKRD